MKKLIAIVLCLLVACTAFACLAFAEGEETTKDPYDHDIPQVITDIMGQPSKTYNDEIHDGFKFFRILTENLSKFAKDVADAFDRFIERVHSFNTNDILGGLKGAFQR